MARNGSSQKNETCRTVSKILPENGKPASSGRKPRERKRVKKPQAEIIVDRMEKPEKVKIQDPNIARKVVY